VVLGSMLRVPSKSRSLTETEMFVITPRFSQMRRGARACATVGLVALTLLAGGCSSGVLDRRALLSEPPKQAELPAGAQREHQRILAAYGGSYSDARLEALIGRTVERLVAASDRPDLHYRVTLLNSPAVNAFALPSGQLYVTRGLIALANDEAEIASVLSHEMSHVIARHAATREDRARQAAIVDSVVHEVLSDPQTGALALANSQVALASFSRAQELEADSLGVSLAAKAGYDPFGAVRFLTAMGRNAELRPAAKAHPDSHSLDFVSSHPATPERVASALVRARQVSPPSSGSNSRAEYLASVDGMVFGEDPSEGFARGRRFLHPRLGFSFTAPEGFILDNTAQAVLGLKDGGAEALRLDVVQVPAEQPLKDYLTSGWIENIDPQSVEELTINGFPAASATAKGDQWTFRLFAIRFGSEVYRFIFAGKHKAGDMDRVFRQSVDTFRRMTLAEIEHTKPLRLRVITVGANDSVERLANRMAITDRRIEHFRILNGLDPGQALKPGDQVKIVVE
jgi:predicted Zn-dependent protease